MSRLSAYRSKRRFDRTHEPRGRLRGHKGSGRFVVQRHQARRLHFDLRLEVDGVYKSWAVTRVPSLDPAIRRLAIAVEDHPVEYGGFEGTIPKGEYGAGVVQIWDRGRWRSETGNDPGYDLGKGHLKFVLHGKRMAGGWSLIRLSSSRSKNREARKAWLLVKERDSHARPGGADILARQTRSVRSHRTLEEIARAARPPHRKSGRR